LVYPFDRIGPEDLLHFVQLDGFADDWEALGFDIENDLWNLENQIMTNPELGDIVPGTGGLRKIRYGKMRDKIGKRKGARVCYVYFKQYALVLLIAAYGKQEKADLSQHEKKDIREYIRRTAAWLNRSKSD